MSLRKYKYIKADYGDAPYTVAPLLRKRFFLADEYENATLILQALGYATVYINGVKLTDDLFLSPVSDYTVLRWYNSYEVGSLLKKGENLIAVTLGNGFYNEEFVTPWDYDRAPWRDCPKLLLAIESGGATLVTTDASWKTTVERSFIVYNQLRSGEYFDARKYAAAWTSLDYDDGAWQTAIEVTADFNGKYELCLAPPIRVHEQYSPVAITANSRGFIVDFGYTLSGYCTLKTHGARGNEIILRYIEQVDENNEIVYLSNIKRFYPQCEYQTDKLICSGGDDEFTPQFTYHGFRYLQIEGVKSKDDFNVTAHFVHQAVPHTSTFKCSSELLNYIYEGGIRSTLSNMFYMMTDCPSREKMGWGNDAQATMEQALTDFDCLTFYQKWYEDIKAAMNEEGGLPAVIPSSGWGFDWGPVCDYLLFEMPYRVYEYTGNSEMLVNGLDHFNRYYDYFNAKIDGGYKFILADWMGDGNSARIPLSFITDIYRIKMQRVISLAKKLKGLSAAEEEKRIEELIAAFTAKYIVDGKCVIDEQTALAMIIHSDLIDGTAIKRQLVEKVKSSNFTLECGMVGVQYLYYALSKCGVADYAYELITKSTPGYKTWFDSGATTLWEIWDGEYRCSHNHQMFSGVIAYFYKDVLGIAPDINAPGYEKITLKPHFLSGLDYARGSVKTVRGEIKAHWARSYGEIKYYVTVPSGVTAIFNGVTLTSGENEFIIKTSEE